MSEKSYAVFEKELRYPTVGDLEKFLFDARTRGANENTKVDFSYVYSKYSVKIPEGSATTSYREPAAKGGLNPLVVGSLLFFLTISLIISLVF